MIGYDDLVWRGDAVFYNRRKILNVVRDSKHPSMWRVRLPDGRLSDMANRTWAKDAAASVACAILNRKPENGTGVGR